MIHCANCESEIENDSLYCDQCGREVLHCVSCRLPGKGSFCENDGGDLKPARSFGSAAPAPLKEVKVAAPEVPQSVVPALRLVNNKLGIRLEIVQGAILGRTKGGYAAQLGALTSISGQHLVFRCDGQGSWSCQDLGSSNGTKYSRENTGWGSLGRLAANTPILLEDSAYLLVANVEFKVEIERPADANATVRL